MKDTRLTKNLKYILLWIFVIFLSISFIAFFTFEGGSVTPRQQDIIGTVDTYKVINTRGGVFQSFYRRFYDYYNSLGQGPVTASINESITKTAFDETVRQYLILQQADKFNVYLSDEELIKGIRDNYGEENFNTILTSDDTAFKKQIETNARYLLRANKVRDILFYHLPVTKKEQTLYLSAAGYKKQLFIAEINLTKQIRARADDDDALFAYFKANQERYVTPPAADDTAAATDDTAAATDDTAAAADDTAAATDDNATASSDDTLAVPATELTAEELQTQFEQQRRTISEDYLIENEQTFTEETKTAFLAEVQALVQEVEDSTAPRNVFSAGIAELGMTLNISDYFSYFETEIPLSASAEETITLPAAFQREIFTADPATTVFAYSEDNDNNVYLVLVLDTTAEPTQPLSTDLAKGEELGFVEKKYQEQLIEATQTRLTNKYYDYLTSFAEIFYRDERQ